MALSSKMHLSNFFCDNIINAQGEITSMFCYANHKIRSKCNDSLLYFMIYKISLTFYSVQVHYSFILRHRRFLNLDLIFCLFIILHRNDIISYLIRFIPTFHLLISNCKTFTNLINNSKIILTT